MKKLALLIICMILSLLCGCEGNTETIIEDTSLHSENNYFSYEILSDGSLLELYSDDSGSKVERAAITNAATRNDAAEIDLKSLNISTDMKIQKLDNGFCIEDTRIYFYDLRGKLLKTEDVPKDRYLSTSLAVSNDMTKIAYIMKEEIKGEDVISLVVRNFETGVVECLQQLNEAGRDKPSYYEKLFFSQDDSCLLFSGVTNPTPDICKECYGWIDIASQALHMFEDEDIEVEFNGNTIWIYDECVEKGQFSTGIVRSINIAEGTSEELSLKEANESQFVRMTDDEERVITMLPDDEQKSVVFRIYEKGNLETEKNFSFDEKESYEASTAGSAKFTYSTKLEKIYFNYYVYETEDDWGMAVLANLYLGE